MDLNPSAEIIKCKGLDQKKNDYNFDSLPSHVYFSIAAKLAKLRQLRGKRKLQFETLKKSLCSVFPDIDEINRDTIIEFLLKKANKDADPESDV